MTPAPVRFLFAAGLDPDAPIALAGPVPSRFDDHLETAAAGAIHRLLAEALAKQARFLLLAAGPGDPSSLSIVARRTLLTLFEQLAEHQVPVFVAPAAGQSAAGWAGLAAGVTALDDSAAVPVICGETLVAQLESTEATEATETAGPVARIGWSTGLGGTAASEADRFDFVALCGASPRQTIRQGRRVVHAPGPLVPCGLDETGLHAATLVELDHIGPARLTPVRTTTLWREQIELALSPATDTDTDTDTASNTATDPAGNLELTGPLRDRLEEALAAVPEQPPPLCLFDWTIRTPALSPPPSPGRLEKLLEELSTTATAATAPSADDTQGSPHVPHVHHVRVVPQLDDRALPGSPGSFAGALFERLAGDPQLDISAWVEGLAQDADADESPVTEPSRVLEAARLLAMRWWHEQDDQRLAS